MSVSSGDLWLVLQGSCIEVETPSARSTSISLSTLYRYRHRLDLGGTEGVRLARHCQLAVTRRWRKSLVLTAEDVDRAVVLALLILGLQFGHAFYVMERH
jgi:hypothetical protein